MLFLPRESYEWDEVELAALELQGAATTPGLDSASVEFTLENLGPASTATVEVQLPDGAFVDPTSVDVAPSSATVEAAEVIDGVLTATVSGVSSDTAHTLSFDVGASLVLGPSNTNATVSVASLTAGATNVVTVEEAFEPDNDTPAGATLITDDALYVSHIGSAGDLDYYALTVPTPLSDVSVVLGNLGADFDLKVYGPPIAPITEPSGEELASVPSPDIDLTPGNDAVASAPLSDLPGDVDGLATYGLSYNRGTASEQVDFTALVAGSYLIEVSGYLGARSNNPYSLQAAVFETQPLACPARPLSTGPTGVGDSITASTNTLVLLNQQRLAALYGTAAAADVAAAVDGLVASANANTSDGVEAAVVAVDADAGVQAAYAAWDGSPCDVTLTNAVVGEIADLVHDNDADQIDYVVVVGNDEVIPFGRVKDATTIANEQSYTTTFSATENNSFRQSFAGKWLLTDTPYGDPAPSVVANTDRLVYLPELSVGRMIETPAEIIAGIDTYLGLGGVLSPESAFVAGYDFLDDGAAATADKLDEVVAPDSTDRLINETWTRDDLAAGIDNGGDAPDLVMVATHYDHYRALPADQNLAGTEDDLYDISDILATEFEGSIVFAVGCHSGLSVPDELIAPTGVEAGDWAQRLAAQGAAVYAANLGFGYGDDAAVALSEQLAVNFADGLDEHQTVGLSHLYAMQEYGSDLTAYAEFDEKALMEWALFGLPFYRLGNPVVPQVADGPPVVETPTGLSGTFDSHDPEIFVDPAPTGDLYYTTNDDGERQTQVTSGYPILPRYEFEVTQQDPTDSRVLDRLARGVVLESLTTIDDVGIDPATARAVVDLAANEPATDSEEVTFFLEPSVSTYLSPAGRRQNVSMTVGAFETTETNGTGTMRRFEEFETTTYYAADPAGDRTKPVFRVVDSLAVGDTASAVTLSLSTELADMSPIVRVAALATPNPMPGQETNWQLFELGDADGDGRWTGSVEFPEPTSKNVQWILMAVDANGNVGWSVSKFLAFQGQAIELPPTTTLSLTIDGDTPAELYNGDVSVAAAAGPGEIIEISIDNGPFGLYTGPVTVTGDGLHTVQVKSGDQLIIEQFRIDTEPPTVTIGSPVADGVYRHGGGVRALFSCADSGSPVSCTATLDGMTKLNGDRVDGVLGVQTLTVTADDGISQASDSVTFRVVAAPELGEIAAPIAPQQLGTETPFTVELTDPDPGDTWTAVWDFGDGTSCDTSNDTGCSIDPAPAGTTSGTVSARHTYAEPGVYTVTVTVTDAYGFSDVAEYRSVVVYDPNGGFATGGGWIIPGGPNSNPGDVLPGLDGTSRANLGFVVKFQQNSTEPQGNFTFNSKVGDFRLKAESFDWLVVNPSRAQFQGLAQIRGRDGLWPFRVIADDPQYGPDRITISVWAPGGDPDLDALVYRASGGLDGGNIQIQLKNEGKGKGKGK